MGIQNRFRMILGVAAFVGGPGQSAVAAPASAQVAVSAHASAQVASPDQSARVSGASAARWVILAPDAALAWFTVLADLRVPGAGAFPFTAGPRTGLGDPAQSQALAASRESEILHFVPLYHPSADRATLAAALRNAAGDGPAAPRATLLTGALRGALSPATRRGILPALADALARAKPSSPGADAIAAWQHTFDAEFAPALTPWLSLEGLDRGRLIVAPAIGAEGRLFAATRDRDDNLAAVGAFTDDPDPDAPLLAFVREICFPAVTRAAREARFDARDPASARRASLAAVRCGAALLDVRLPDRAAAYRAFWLRRIGSPPGSRFDHVFPADPALSSEIERALRRLAPARGRR